MNQTPSHVFIGGHRKCGTTLLLSLLDNHPDLVTYPMDIHVFYAYYPTYTHGNYSNKERLERLDQVIFRNMQKIWTEKGWSDRLDIGTMRKIFFELAHNIDLSNIKDVIDAQVEAFKITTCGLKNNTSPLVIKETSIEIYANYILEKFPRSKFIHVIRDPRDNYAALKSGLSKRYKNFNDSANTIMMSMINRCGLGMRMAAINKNKFKNRYMILRHEDTVADTKNQMKKIAEFIKIKYDNTMTLPTVIGLPTIGNNFDGIDMSNIKNININRWKERITEEEAQIIEFYFGNEMTQYGYELAHNLQTQSIAASKFYEWSNYKYFYFDHFDKL
jgi:hypothetical protein